MRSAGSSRRSDFHFAGKMRADLTWKRGDSIVFQSTESTCDQGNSIVSQPTDFTWTKGDSIVFQPRDSTWKRGGSIVFGHSPGLEQRASFTTTASKAAQSFKPGTARRTLGSPVDPNDLSFVTRPPGPKPPVQAASATSHDAPLVMPVVTEAIPSGVPKAISPARRPDSLKPGSPSKLVRKSTSKPTTPLQGSAVAQKSIDRQAVSAAAASAPEAKTPSSLRTSIPAVISQDSLPECSSDASETLSLHSDASPSEPQNQQAVTTLITTATTLDPVSVAGHEGLEPDSGPLWDKSSTSHRDPLAIETVQEHQDEMQKLLSAISKQREEIEYQKEEIKKHKEESSKHEKEVAKHREANNSLRQEHRRHNKALHKKYDDLVTQWQKNYDDLFTQWQKKNDDLSRYMQAPQPAVRLGRHQDPQFSQEHEKAKSNRAKIRGDYLKFQQIFVSGKTSIKPWRAVLQDAQLALYAKEVNYWKTAAEKLDLFVREISAGDEKRIETEMTDESRQLDEARRKHRAGILSTLAAELRSRVTRSEAASVAFSDSISAFDQQTLPNLDGEAHFLRSYIRLLRCPTDRYRGLLATSLIRMSRLSKFQLPIARLSRATLQEQDSIRIQLKRTKQKDPLYENLQRRRELLLEYKAMSDNATGVLAATNKAAEAAWMQKQPIPTQAIMNVVVPLDHQLEKVYRTLTHGRTEIGNLVPHADTHRLFGQKLDAYGRTIGMLHDLRAVTYLNAVLDQQRGITKRAAKEANFARGVLQSTTDVMQNLSSMLRRKGWSTVQITDHAMFERASDDIVHQPDNTGLDSLRVANGEKPTDNVDLIKTPPMSPDNMPENPTGGLDLIDTSSKNLTSPPPPKVLTTALEQNDNDEVLTDAHTHSTLNSMDILQDNKTTPPTILPTVLEQNDNGRVPTDVQPIPTINDPMAMVHDNGTRPPDQVVTADHVDNDQANATLEEASLLDSSPVWKSSELSMRELHRNSPLRNYSRGQHLRRKHLPVPTYIYAKGGSTIRRRGLRFSTWAPRSLDASSSAGHTDETPYLEGRNNALDPCLPSERSHPSKIPVVKLAELSKASSDDTAAHATTSSSKEKHVPLEYQIPLLVFEKALLASPTSAAAFWKHSMYKGPQDETIKIHYCRKYDQAEKQAKLFLDEKVIGFDMEWEPRANPSSIKENVSLIQVASESRIALFQVAAFLGDTAEELMPPSLRAILESRSILKAGVNVATDFSRLRRYFGIQGQGLFELSHLYRVVMFSETDPTKVNRKLVSMSEHVQRVLHLPLDKGAVRTSAWSRSLNQQQIDYAASDAYAGLRIFDALEERRKSMTPTPPRPALYEDKLPLLLRDGEMPKKVKDL